MQQTIIRKRYRMFTYTVDPHSSSSCIVPVPGVDDRDSPHFSIGRCSYIKFLLLIVSPLILSNYSGALSINVSIFRPLSFSSHLPSIYFSFYMSNVNSGSFFIVFN